METEPTDSPGILGSLRTLADGLLSTTQDRLELISIELQEEKLRLVQTLVWASVILHVGMMALMFASLTLVYAFWESARLAVLGGLALVYAGTLVTLIVLFRRSLERQPKLLASTLQVLQSDRSCIRGKN